MLNLKTRRVGYVTSREIAAVHAKAAAAGGIVVDTGLRTVVLSPAVADRLREGIFAALTDSYRMPDGRVVTGQSFSYLRTHLRYERAALSEDLLRRLLPLLGFALVRDCRCVRKGSRAEVVTVL